MDADTPTNKSEARDKLRKAIVNYRIMCDLALSERDDGVYPQKEYEAAIEHQLDVVMALIDQYTAGEKVARIEGKLETAKYFKKYMVSTSPFISEVLEPYINDLEAQLKKSIRKESNRG